MNNSFKLLMIGKCKEICWEVRTSSRRNCQVECKMVTLDFRVKQEMVRRAIPAAPVRLQL